MRSQTFRTETRENGSRDSITANNSNKVVEFIDLKNLPSFYGPTFFHGWPYA